MLIIHRIKQLAILPIIRIPTTLLPIDDRNEFPRAWWTCDQDVRLREIAVCEEDFALIRMLVAVDFGDLG
jgi:hypothetical protein